MDERINEIRKLVNCWFSFGEIPSSQDIMPHVVYLLEQYDVHVKILEDLKENKE